jgi:hypothetical protein
MRLLTNEVVILSPRCTRGLAGFIKWNVYTTIMDFPFSIYVWHAPRRLTDKPFWQEELRANTQQMAIYAAGLLYNAGVLTRTRYANVR